MNPLALHFRPGAGGRSWKTDYRDIVNLSSNELHHPRLETLFSAWLATVPYGLISRYPYWPQATSAVAAYLGCGVDRVILCPGSDEAIKVVVHTLAATTRRMILSWPNYESYERYAALDHVDVIRVAYPEADGPADHARQLIARMATQRPSVVVVTNPNGYTGEALELAAMEAIARAAASHGHLLIVDEAYSAFAGIDHRSLLDIWSGVLLLRSFSKGFGIAGLRIAAMVGHPEMIDYVGRWSCTNPVSALSLHALEFCVQNEHALAEIRRDVCALRDSFARALAARFPAWEVASSACNFLLVDVGCPAALARAVGALADARIVVKKFDDRTPFPSCFRITVGTPTVMDQALSSLSHGFAQRADDAGLQVRE
jgi:histidinol-phosphate aminotransferase